MKIGSKRLYYLLGTAFLIISNIVLPKTALATSYYPTPIKPVSLIVILVALSTFPLSVLLSIALAIRLQFVKTKKDKATIKKLLSKSVKFVLVWIIIILLIVIKAVFDTTPRQFPPLD
jgi:hypothetical protein